MNEQVIRTEVRSAIDDHITNYKFVLVNYFVRSKKFSVVLEAKVDGEINILQASGLCIKEVTDKLIDQYNWLCKGEEREKVEIASA